MRAIEEYGRFRFPTQAQTLALRTTAPAFYAKKDELVAGLRALSVKVCGYTGRSCDCKYGCAVDRGGEQTGCCEAFSAAALFEVMTKVDYEKLVAKAKRKRARRR